MVIPDLNLPLSENHFLERSQSFLQLRHNQLLVLLLFIGRLRVFLLLLEELLQLEELLLGVVESRFDLLVELSELHVHFALVLHVLLSLETFSKENEVLLDGHLESGEFVQISVTVLEFSVELFIDFHDSFGDSSQLSLFHCGHYYNAQA